MVKKSLTQDQLEMIQKVDDLKKQGLTSKEAWAKAGFKSDKTYYNWKTRMGDAEKDDPPKRAYNKSIKTHIKIPSQAHVIFGSPEQIAEILLKLKGV